MPFPVIFALIMLTVSGAAYLFVSHKQKGKIFSAGKDAPSAASSPAANAAVMENTVTANEIIGIKDIKDNFLYSTDGYIFAYLRIQPISTALMTDSDKIDIAAKLGRALSPFKIPFKMFLISRPADVKKLLNHYDSIKKMTSDRIKRDSLNKTMQYISGLSGNVTERQTYICLWVNGNSSTKEELLRTVYEFKSALESCNVVCSVADEYEITSMCNLFCNPMEINPGVDNISPPMPFIPHNTAGNKI